MTSITILAVDDEPQNLAVLRQILAPQYKLIFATNGVDAVSAATRLQPSIVLLDINMPGMSGYEVCEALKKNTATQDIPVVFVTALSDVGQESHGFAVGGVDYIVKPVHPDVVRARVRAHLSLVRADRLEKSYKDAISMLGEAGHYSDADTAEHVWRMAAYSSAIAKALGLDDEECKLIENAAPLHDTGKIGIPSAILRKPAALDEAEWAVMKTHPHIGWNILRRSDALVFQKAAEIALCHHEKWDGTGYPRQLAGDAIPQSARIVALADVFDALCSKRPYKDAWPYEKCLSQIRESAGSHFDPEIVQAFLKIQPEILKIKAEWDHVATGSALGSSSPKSEYEPHISVKSALIIDDDETSVERVRSILQTLGIKQISSVKNGREAEKVFAAGARPDLVILDIFMPEKDGIEVVDDLASYGFDGGLILMSAGGAQMLDLATFIGQRNALHVWATLEKPLSIGNVALAIENGLTSR